MACGKGERDSDVSATRKEEDVQDINATKEEHVAETFLQSAICSKT